MSSARLISPLLDQFTVGECISEHDGVRTYPAMREGTEERYIVKVISIPASHLQLDAFLLSGVYSSREEALAYYKDMANSAAHEAEALRYLAKLEGFTPYEGWQVVKSADGSGYEVYLLGTYKKSLETLIAENAVTQLGAVNMGLDICAALVAARNTGCLCVDLRPGNVFLGEDGKYRIGDLGYIPLSCLTYSSLPDRYRSEYTAPEIMDPMASISPSADIYALGRFLYRIYNGGALPEIPDANPPAYADAQMAEIILKACASDPEKRWQDPKEMGQALVAYMQTSSVNDVPIVLPKEPEEAPAEPEPEEVVTAAEEIPEMAGTAEPEITEPEVIVIEEIPTDLPEEEPLPEEPTEEPVPEEPADEPETADEPEEVPGFEETEYDELNFLDSLYADESALNDDTLAHIEVPDDTAEMLSQIDELVEHETPAPVVVPEPIEVPIPERIIPEKPEAEEETAEEPVEESVEEPSEDEVSVENPAQTEPTYEGYAPEKKKSHWQSLVAAVMIIAALCAGAWYYYNNYYLQSVDSLDVNFEQTTVVIQVRTAIPEDQLTVTCTDSYGNSRTSAVKNGIARFDDLTPDTHYNVVVSMSGFHKTTGAVKAGFTTWPGTTILNLSAYTGAESTTAIVSFSVEGVDCENWILTYAMEGQAPVTVNFSGHLVTLTDLVVGENYRISLAPDADTAVSGTTDIFFTPSEIVYAENLRASLVDGQITVTWDAPDGSNVEFWNVRCFNNNGYDRTEKVTDTAFVFTDISDEDTYLVEVTAAGMTQSVRETVSEGAAGALSIISVDSEKIALSCSGNGSMILTWKVNGVEEQSMTFVGNAPEINPVLPGADYTITLYDAETGEALSDAVACTVPEAPDFDLYGLRSEDIIFYMLRTPSKENWTRADINGGSYTTTFVSGADASYLLRISGEVPKGDDELGLMFAVYQKNSLISTEGRTLFWADMWDEGYCPIDIYDMPRTPGDYHMEIYLGGCYLNTIYFTIN